MNRIQIILISLVFFAWGCDPVDVPKPKNEEPVFSVRFEYNGESKNYLVGEDSLIIKPGFEVNNLGIPIYTSTVHREGCQSADCEKLVFKFNADMLYNQDNISFDNSFHKGTWEYVW